MYIRWYCQLSHCISGDITNCHVVYQVIHANCPIVYQVILPTVTLYFRWYCQLSHCVSGDTANCHIVFQVILFPVYEHFVISTFTCLRRWMHASEINPENPDEMAYWDQPPPAPEFKNVEPKKKKKPEKKPRFRTTTVPPNADFAVRLVICLLCLVYMRHLT